MSFPPKLKGFTPQQQPELRLYLTWAWAAYCQEESLDPKERCSGTRCDQCDYCAWYREVLKGATGKTSSTQCNAGRDYDFFMRDLEIIHAKATKWQERATDGDARRIAHELRSAVGDHHVEEWYMQGVARRMLKLDVMPSLETLTRGQLIVILGEVKRYLRRRLKREGTLRPVEVDFPGFES